MLNVIWIGVLCRNAGQNTAEISQFQQNLHTWGALCPSRLPGKIWQETVDPWSMITHKSLSCWGPIQYTYTVLYTSLHR